MGEFVGYAVAGAAGVALTQSGLFGKLWSYAKPLLAKAKGLLPFGKPKEPDPLKVRQVEAIERIEAWLHTQDAAKTEAKP